MFQQCDDFMFAVLPISFRRMTAVSNVFNVPYYEVCLIQCIYVQFLEIKDKLLFDIETHLDVQK